MNGFLKRAKNSVIQPLSLLRQYQNIAFPLIDPSEKVEEKNFGIEKYYPVLIGDILSSRYCIVGKLGFGISSTVWLAQYLPAHNHVAIKIFTNDGEDTDEVSIYKHISQGNKARLGYRYVRTALDSFELTSGRGGKHSCLVHEPLWDSVRTLLERCGRDRLPEDLLRVILRLSLALDYLHTDRNLIHTGNSDLAFSWNITDFIGIDIKSDNILHLIEDTSILAAFGEAEISQPSPRKIVADREVYVSRTLDMPNSFGEPVLCDLGNAVYGTRINGEDAYPDIYRCAEVILQLPWSYSADIWNVGTMIWDIFEGKHLFNGYFHPRSPPLELVKQGKRSAEWFDGDGKWLSPDNNEPERLPLLPLSSLEDVEENLDGKNKELFLKFIGSMLQWEPEKRKTARQLLDDPWLTNSQG